MVFQPPPPLIASFLYFYHIAGRICLSCLALRSDFDQKDRLERIQYRALLVVSKSPKVPYCSLLNQFCLTTLSARRDKLCFKFVVGILANPWLHEILPPEHITSRPRLPRQVAEPVLKHCQYQLDICVTQIVLFPRLSRFLILHSLVNNCIYLFVLVHCSFYFLLSLKVFFL